MGIYYWPVCVERGEMFDSPYAAKDREWSGFGNPSGPLLAWTLCRHWCGASVKMIHDAGGFDEIESLSLRNIWNEVARDYLKTFGPIKGAACVAWRHRDHDEDPTVCLCDTCNAPLPEDER